MRRSTLLLIGMAFQILLVILIFIHSGHMRKASDRHAGKAALVEQLGLTDLCLFSEASYTRHLSQADFHTPFQDFPLSVEHFPSGSLVPPPSILKKMHGKKTDETLD